MNIRNEKEYKAAINRYNELKADKRYPLLNEQLRVHLACKIFDYKESITLSSTEL